MLNLSLIAASAAATLFAGVNAGEFGLIGKRTGGPAQPSCTDYTPFVYAGCFTDPSSPRALLYSSDLDRTTMTVEKCVAFCKGNDYEYAGLEYYGQCFCGASVNGVQTDESKCNYKCTGNQTEICGGTDLISVYQDPTFPTVDDLDISDYQTLGCYHEGLIGRSLAWRQDQVASVDLTLEKCLSACKVGGYAFAGVEYGQECYCGVVLGNGTLPVLDEQCDMSCTGNPNQKCGGRDTLNLYVASDLESTEPCGGPNLPPVVSSSTSTVSSTTTTSSSTSSTPYTSTTSTTPTTSTTSTPPTSSPTSSTSTTPPPTTSKPSTTTSASLCTSTFTVPPPAPTCEYKCGKWCSNPLPDFNDNNSCAKAVSACAIQKVSCFLKAGFPDNLKCFDFADWCNGISKYCSNSCPGKNCGISACKKNNPPAGGPPTPPKPVVSTTVYTCATKPATTSTSSTSSDCVPVPTSVNICKQPNNPSKGYTSQTPVDDIELPCLTCNNWKADYSRGFAFKLYTDANTKSCKSYGRGGKQGPTQACKDACDAQYAACTGTYAEGCKDNDKNKPKLKYSFFKRNRYDGGDNFDKATKKCKDQRDDCYSVNTGVSGGSRCNSYNSGWW